MKVNSLLDFIPEIWEKELGQVLEPGMMEIWVGKPLRPQNRRERLYACFGYLLGRWGERLLTASSNWLLKSRPPHTGGLLDSYGSHAGNTIHLPKYDKLSVE